MSIPHTKDKKLTSSQPPCAPHTTRARVSRGGNSKSYYWACMGCNQRLIDRKNPGQKQALEVWETMPTTYYHVAPCDDGETSILSHQAGAVVDVGRNPPSKGPRYPTPPYPWQDRPQIATTLDGTPAAFPKGYPTGKPTPLKQVPKPRVAPKTTASASSTDKSKDANLRIKELEDLVAKETRIRELEAELKELQKPSPVIPLPNQAGEDSRRTRTRQAANLPMDEEQGAASAKEWVLAETPTPAGLPHSKTPP